MTAKSELENKAVADREPSQLHKNMAEWLTNTTGYQDVDLKTVQLVASLRSKFQRSDMNQADLAARREAAEAALAERAKRAHERNEKAQAKAAELAAKDGAKITKTTTKAKKEAAAAAAEAKAADDAVTAGVVDPFDAEAPMVPLEEKPKATTRRKPATTAKPRSARKPAKA